MEFAYDIAVLPLDEWTGEDGDDSLLFNGPIESDPSLDTEGIIRNEMRMLAGATLSTVYVPFKRTVKLGTVGPDVIAIKRAMNAAAKRRIGTGHTRLFGPYAVRNLKTFQRSKGLTADGVYGLYTHRKLAPYIDSYGRWLMGQTKVLSSADLKRQKIVATAMHGVANRYGIHYTQSSLRMMGVRYRIKPPGYPRYEDCSSFATWCYWVAGVNDPNGLGYNGFGFTGTLAANGTRISTAQMRPGDLIFYGSYPHSHVTIYVGSGRCVSHGNESGPSLLHYAYRPVNSIRRYL
jgi:cell wall-associated NlpC family hydrolase